MSVPINKFWLPWWQGAQQRLPFLKTAPVVNVIRLQGPISNASRGLDNPSLAPVIEKAFTKGRPAAVALEINCPGGSPAQSSLIAARIRRLAEEKEVPVVAFVEDVAGSGGYWLACAADEIIVDDSSLVGSIGVISSSFGAQDAIARIGVERRVHTAGKSKSMLDPFRDEKPEDVARLNRWLEQLHETFIGWVKSRRGEKLADNPDLFSGEVWIGRHAVEVGLADAVGHLAPVMKERFGKDVKFRRFGPKKPMFARLGAQVIEDAASHLEARAAFARFGL